MDVEHIRLHGTPATYCAHPRQGGLFNFGGGEVAVIHRHAGCCYQQLEDVGHTPPGAHARAHYLLQRSVDHGRTWPAQFEVAIFDEAAPEAQRRARLFDAGKRETIDLDNPDSVIMFGTSWPDWVCFALRSADRGRHWEYKPTIVSPPPGLTHCHKDNHPLLQLTDGRWAGAFQCGPDPVGPWLYSTADNGLSFQPLTQIVTGATYAGLLRLPGGRMSCYTYVKADMDSILQVNHSDDGGATWGSPRPIVSDAGQAAWSDAGSTSGDVPKGATPYRSPWPVLLRDGRIVVVFARRCPPAGIGVIVSEDGGETFGPEIILRADGSGIDLGYPVATELDDGTIFTAYYFSVEDGNRFGGSRFIAGSFFQLD